MGAVQHGLADVLRHRRQLGKLGLQGFKRGLDLGGVADGQLNVEGSAGHLGSEVQ